MARGVDLIRISPATKALLRRVSEARGMPMSTIADKVICEFFRVRPEYFEKIQEITLEDYEKAREGVERVKQQEENAKAKK